MKVFISGPMSGKPNYNRAAFFKAQEELEKHGYSVWNPAWLAYPSDTEFTKDDMHIIDFAALRRCDAIYMLKGWKHSKGAQEECEYAIMRGLMIMYEGAHCWGNESVFDQEFAYDEAVKNRTNYQLEAIKENVKEKYNTLDRRIKSIEEELAWDKWKNDLPDNFCSNRIDSLEKWRNDFAECYTLNITNLRKETSDKINGLNQAINDVEADLDNFKDETDGKMNDIYDTLHRHGENLDTCEKNCANRYARNFNKINKLEKDVKSIKESLRLDSDKNTPVFAFNNYRLDNHADRINVLEDEVEAIKESIGTDNLQEQLEKDFADVYTEFQNTKDKVNEIEFGYIDWSSKMSSAIAEMTKVKETVKGLNSLVTTLGERNGVLSDKLESGIEENRHYRLSVTEQLGTIRSRLKAIEKRLNIKPFYAPTEDEKDDD